MSIIIVKNNTGASVFIEDMGTAVPGSGQRTFSDIFDFTEICVSEDLKIYVNDSTFTINDGTSDLIIADAIEYLDCKNEDGGGTGTVTFDDVVGLLAINQVRSLYVSSTTLLTYQDKLTITVGVGLEVGTYFMLSSADFQAENNNKQVGVRLYNTSDNIVYAESIQQTNNQTNWFAFAGQGIITLDGIAEKTIKIQFRNVGGTTCNIRNAHLIFGRIE